MKSSIFSGGEYIQSPISLKKTNSLRHHIMRSFLGNKVTVATVENNLHRFYCKVKTQSIKSQPHTNQWRY
jgi:hypothetical protein